MSKKGKRQWAKTGEKELELYTSRLTLGLLYVLSFDFLLLTSAASFSRHLRLLSVILLAVSSVLLAVSSAFCLVRKREKESGRVHSPRFLLCSAASLFISSLLFFVFGEAGLWPAAGVGFFFCFFYFLSLVYRRWVVFLFSLCTAYFLFGFLNQISFFSALFLTRALLGATLLAFGAALLFLVWVLCAREEESFPRAPFWFSFLCFGVSQILTLLFEEHTVFFSFFPLVYFCLFLICYVIRWKMHR